jgi:hypothetical protein
LALRGKAATVRIAAALSYRQSVVHKPVPKEECIMTFADYKGLWEITSVDEKVAETVGHWIVIGGIPSAVKVLCLDGVHKGHAFAAYSYDESNE